jgi:L-ascorbate metabolism protein UlaG (beta-lactamase superfamily)
MGDSSTMPALGNLHWLGHDSFLIVNRQGQRIYIDPYQLARHEPADLILITHQHGDHYSPADVAKLRTAQTVVVTVPPVTSELQGSVVTVVPGDRIVAAGIEVEAVPAYNLNKFRSPGHPYHPRDAGLVGFVLTVDGQRIYHAGDTDQIPEMAHLGDLAIALLPVSGTYVMTAEEAAQAAALLKPGVAVPMHYGAIVGSAEDAQRFAQLCRAQGIAVQVLPREGPRPA